MGEAQHPQPKAPPGSRRAGLHFSLSRRQLRRSSPVRMLRTVRSVRYPIFDGTRWPSTSSTAIVASMRWTFSSSTLNGRGAACDSIIISMSETASRHQRTRSPLSPLLSRPRYSRCTLIPGSVVAVTSAISTRQLNRAVHAAAEAAGIKKRVSPHTLRHSFVACLSG
jgi:Phage integrase family